MSKRFKVCTVVCTTVLLAGFSDVRAEEHVYNAFECSQAQQDNSPYTPIGTMDVTSGGTVQNSSALDDLWLVCPITHAHTIQGDITVVNAVTVRAHDLHATDAVICRVTCVDALTSSYYSSDTENTFSVGSYKQLSIEGVAGYIDGACFIYCKIPDTDSGTSGLEGYVVEFETTL